MSSQSDRHGRRTASYDQVSAGTAIPELSKGPMTALHLMRWSSAIENWHRIHYDTQFAVEHEGLPDILVNGSWKQHVLSQMLKDWAGPEGWVARLRFQYRSADIRGDIITAFGRVESKEARGDTGLLRCSIGIRNSRGQVSTEGDALVAVPVSSRPLPYPLRTEI